MKDAIATKGRGKTEKRDDTNVTSWTREAEGKVRRQSRELL